MGKVLSKKSVKKALKEGFITEKDAKEAIKEAFIEWIYNVECNGESSVIPIEKEGLEAFDDSLERSYWEAVDDDI